MNKVSWYTPEYVHTHKTTDWYWVVGIVALSIALISIILNNVIFGILIIVSASILALYAAREPEIIYVELDTSGIHMGKIFHPYSEIESFWVDVHTPHPKIIIKLKKRLSLFVSVLIDDMDPDIIREYLREHIPQERHTEPLLEKILIYLGF